VVYLNHRKDDTRCTDNIPNAGSEKDKINKKRKNKKIRKTADLRKKQKFRIKINPLKGKRRQKKCKRNEEEKFIYEGSTKECTNIKKERLK